MGRPFRAGATAGLKPRPTAVLSLYFTAGGGMRTIFAR
jgi:hypothetical protein